MTEITYDQIAKASSTIKTTNIKGKEYADVAQRIKAFRMVYPTGFILTNIISNEDGVCVVQAQVGHYDDNGNPLMLATGDAYEEKNSSYINKTSYIENASTSAIGRALGACGFGIDTSVCSAEELNNALDSQAANEQKKAQKATQKQIELITELVPDLDKMCAYYKVKDVSELSAEDASKIIKMKTRKKE